MKKRKETQKTCYVIKKHPHLQELETVPPVCPHGFQLFFRGWRNRAQKSQIWENIERNKS